MARKLVEELENMKLVLQRLYDKEQQEKEMQKVCVSLIHSKLYLFTYIVFRNEKRMLY